MASCSSSFASSQSPKKYDVFINFRGEDTRNNFTSHLHDALHRNNIETYIDYRVEKGDDVWPSLVKAIEDSILFLVIISENYASSTWCLDELTKILECAKDQRQRVIPVFYKIDPSHVRNQTGSYEIAFAKYEQGKNKQQLHKWRASLTEAANLAGWHCNSERNEAVFIKEIVEYVKSKLGYMYQTESDSKGLVGIHKKVADLELLLCNGSQDVQFIGIWGMGGIGKTTLARALFDKLCFAYEGSCFLANVREESKKHGIIHLKNKLILTLLEDKESHVGMLDGAFSYAMRRLSRKKVLVVLDDVDDLEQLENLVRHHWFGLDSTVIITSRDKQVLRKNVNNIYKIEALNFEEAFHLFSLNAFKNEYLHLEFEELAKNMVYYANGVPLVLKVLGSFLYEKSKEEWESELEKLKKMPFTKVQNVLRLSFDGLDNEEKNIFLHIACFFKNKELDEIKSFLDACGYSTTIALKNLEDKALLIISRDKVFMHDLIEEMGKEIDREESRKYPEKRSRLWDPDDVFHVLKNNKGFEAIEGITLNTSKIPDLHLSPQIFSRMQKLKFLEFYKHGDESNRLHFHHGVESLPNELRFLRWDEYPSKCFPATFSAEKLVNIEMPNSQLRTLWDGVQNLVNLKKINLRESIHLIELPDFSKALHLKEVNLNRCTDLPNVHPSILSLHSLEKLSLACCKSLTCLKTKAHLRSLRDLSLNGCSRLTEFSVTSVNMLSLNLSETAIIDGMSSSSGSLSKIKRLTLDGCTSLTYLPSKLVDLRYLQSLSIEGCNKLALNLRFIFDRLRSLRILSLENCRDLFELPDNISLLSSLVLLTLSGTYVDSLPVSIKHLSRLEAIWLDECKRLRSLPELPPSIETLSANNCTSLETLRFSSKPTAISAVKDDEVFLNFENCVKLDEQSIKAIVAKAMLESKKRWGTGARVVYPGSKVPEWFVYRTTESFISMDLSSIPRSKDWTFIFCAIVSHSPSTASIDIVWDFSNGQTVCDEHKFCGIYVDPIASDHVCLWHPSKLPPKVKRMIDENRADDENTNELSIVFICEDVDMEIKEFGICPTYALEYQTFTKQMELELKPSPVGKAVGCSYDNTYEKETLPQKHKSRCFIEEIE